MAGTTRTSRLSNRNGCGNLLPLLWCAILYSLPIANEELHVFTGGMVGKDLWYVYWDDLAALDSCRNKQDVHQGVISCMRFTVHFIGTLY